MTEDHTTASPTGDSSARLGEAERGRELAGAYNRPGVPARPAATLRAAGRIFRPAE
jgi:hypothetical protein